VVSSPIHGSVRAPSSQIIRAARLRFTHLSPNRTRLSRTTFYELVGTAPSRQ
jgi:hypothetical protein